MESGSACTGSRDLQDLGVSSHKEFWTSDGKTHGWSLPSHLPHLRPIGWGWSRGCSPGCGDPGVGSCRSGWRRRRRRRRQRPTPCWTSGHGRRWSSAVGRGNRTCCPLVANGEKTKTGNTYRVNYPKCIQKLVYIAKGASLLRLPLFICSDYPCLNKYWTVVSHAHDKLEPNTLTSIQRKVSQLSPFPPALHNEQFC